MKLCTGVDPPKGSWKKYPPTYSHPLVAAILQFNMAAILGLIFSYNSKTKTGRNSKLRRIQSTRQLGYVWASFCRFWAGICTPTLQLRLLAGYCVPAGELSVIACNCCLHQLLRGPPLLYTPQGLHSWL